LFILSDSPPEKDVQWSDQGMLASYKFIHKFWLIHQDIKKRILLKKDSERSSAEDELSQFTNELVDKVTRNLENFHYNVIIANFHEAYNFLLKLNKDQLSSFVLLKNYLKILTMLSPVVPHFTAECLIEIEHSETISWPLINKKNLEKKIVKIVVQINGKKRGLISCDKNIDEKKLLNIIKSEKQYKKYFEDKVIIKTIYVRDRLINLILK